MKLISFLVGWCFPAVVAAGVAVAPGSLRPNRLPPETRVAMQNPELARVRLQQQLAAMAAKLETSQKALQGQTPDQFLSRQRISASPVGEAPTRQDVSRARESVEKAMKYVPQAQQAIRDAQRRMEGTKND